MRTQEKLSGQRRSNADMDESPVSDASERDDGAGEYAEEEQPLARVRYGIAKELRLYADIFVAESLEEHEETRISLDNIKRVVLTPGEHVPSKLVLMFDLDDDNTVIVAEGMTNVRDFRTLLAKLHELRPEIELDPPDMDEQLQPAHAIRLLWRAGDSARVLAHLPRHRLPRRPRWPISERRISRFAVVSTRCWWDRYPPTTLAASPRLLAHAGWAADRARAE
jgi:hypothetical protein